MAGPSPAKGVVMTAAVSTTKIRVGTGHAGERLDRVLASHLPELSRTRLKRLILDGCVTEHGTVLRDPSRRVRDDQDFVVILPEIEEAAPVAQPIELDIRF